MDMKLGYCAQVIFTFLVHGQDFGALMNSLNFLLYGRHCITIILFVISHFATLIHPIIPWECLHNFAGYVCIWFFLTEKRIKKIPSQLSYLRSSTVAGARRWF